MPVQGKPVIIPAKVLDKFWISLFQSVANLTEQTAELNATLIPYNDNGDSGEPIYLEPINVFHEVATDPEAAQIFGLIQVWLEKKAVEQGKLEAP